MKNSSLENRFQQTKTTNGATRIDETFFYSKEKIRLNEVHVDSSSYQRAKIISHLKFNDNIGSIYS